jgi:hypothetical protein
VVHTVTSSHDIATNGVQTRDKDLIDIRRLLSLIRTIPAVLTGWKNEIKIGPNGKALYRDHNHNDDLFSFGHARSHMNAL